MSFLDNLENNLKAMEGRDATGLDDRKQRELDRKHAVATGPWADELKKGPYAAAIMQQATRAGYRIRTKVNLVWMGSTLRLEARGHKLELRPTSSGVIAVFSKGNTETSREEIDLSDTPAPLVDRWMKVLAEQKRLDDESAALDLKEIE